jgi:hypothetical protein
MKTIGHRRHTRSEAVVVVDEGMLGDFSKVAGKVSMVDRPFYI